MQIIFAAGWPTSLRSRFAGRHRWSVSSPRASSGLLRSEMANVNCQFHADADNIRRWLADQLTQPVRWQASMERLIAEGVERFIEIGDGQRELPVSRGCR